MRGDSVPAAGVIDPVYLPFPAEQLRSHLASSLGSEAHERVERDLMYYLKSADRYHRFKGIHTVTQGMPLSKQRRPRQIEKDERFWVVTCLMSFFYAADRPELLGTLLRPCFGDAPPLEGFQSWTECLDGDLRLFFEVKLPSPPSYKRLLQEELSRRQIVPYVLDAARRADTGIVRKDLEGSTHVDAVLINPQNGFAVLFEAKVLSDISIQVSYDTLRNQLARTVDVMLEEDSSLPEPLGLRKPERTLFALLTPELFRQQPSSRLYGWLHNAYRTEPMTLARDLPHRKTVDWPAIARRIGWLTWEDCSRVLPGSCPWLGCTSEMVWQ